ncbi:MAG: MOSC N-terminal beta barrel domain-containing protein [Rubrivivax sp.]|nr:MOSC N-terminal beta barrel domain-containing protein [Rubrivivax sp.]
MSDLPVTLRAMYLHPVKSCGGIAVDEALVIETGLEFDRAWMVVDEHGEFLSQRELPRMALVAPTLRTNDLVLRAPGMLALHLALDAVEAPCRVRVWDDEVRAYDMGDVAAQWFSDFLGRRARLVRFDPEHERLSDARWSGGVEARAAFADGFALLVVSTASLAELNRRLAERGQPAVGVERFRPNLVLDGLDAHGEDWIDTLTLDSDDGPVVLKLTKPCARCSIPNVDPASAATGTEPGDTLAGYRADARLGGAVTFGMNAVVVSGVEHVLKAGAHGRATIAF